MCTIIPFPTNRIQPTNGYKNLKALFEICDSLESCNFFLEANEQLFEKGNITESELYTLRRIGRQKRQELAAPKAEPIKAEAPGNYCYTPEMGQQKPEGCQMEAGLCYYGKHYWVNTPLELKGRGITENSPNWAKGSKKDLEGWRSYTVTIRAFEKLKEKYSISMECHLD